MLKKYLVVVFIVAMQQLNAQNYVRSWEARIPVSDPATLATRPVTEVMQTTGYVDGLGRPLQTVVKQGSLVTATSVSGDMVSANVYDPLGREVQKFLPYISTSTDGLIKTNPLTEQTSFYNTQLSGQGETYFYGSSDIEASPLNRIAKSYPPGNSWVGSGRGTSMTYLNNTTADDVKIWTVNASGNYTVSSQPYGDGLLIETHTLDERGNQVVEYKDKEGKVLLKKVQVGDAATLGASYAGWLSTYYLYDSYSNLRLVIQPKAIPLLIANGWTLNTTILNELCFRYEYDDKNRMIIKRVPGAAEVYMVYDQWDRLVLTQDGNLRTSNQWIFTKYDYLNRPVITGLYTNITYTAQSTMQSYVNSLTTGATANFESTNTSSIGYTTTASFPSASNPSLLTITFYDDYNWAVNYNSIYATKDNTNDGLFYSAGGSLYAQPLTASSKTKGMVTGTVTYVLNSSQTVVSSVFYDDRGRALQSKSGNLSGGLDITTTQYNFAGQPLMSLQQHQKTGSSAVIKVSSKMEYDALGRLLQIKKQVIQTGGVQTPEKIIVRNEYDASGQLKNKILSPEFNSNVGLEKLNYDYNIRGWLLGMNRDFIKDINTTNYFGFELGYDKTNTAVSGTSYTNPQYNGNIEGTVWKSKGDNQKRKYDFKYDNVNRLLAADFGQYTSGSFTNANVNFTIKMGDGINYSSAYDENGNILQMQQWGLKFNSSDKIDDLNYTYYNGGNKLQNVIDFKDLATTKLGDFRTSTGHPQYGTKSTIINNTGFLSNQYSISDYGYDVNGNMITDRNKDLSGSVGVDQNGGAITYNYLNLPSVITVASKGTITYTYDAAGNKLKKTTVENGVSVTYSGTAYTNVTVTTTTDYDAGFVYESKGYSNSAVNTGMGYTDKLQFTGQEEGRVRANYNNTATPNTITSFAFDYMVKDHLGNVRMVLTDEQKVDHYPTATLEADALSSEQNFYDITAGDVVGSPSPLPSEPSNLLGYLNDNGTNNPFTYGNPAGASAKMLKLNAGTGSKTGMSMVLKVMAGDQLDILGKSYYKQPTGTVTNSNFNATNIITAFLSVGGAGNAAVLHGGTTGIITANTTGAMTPLGTFISNSNNTNPYNQVKAGLCYILFDEQFNLVSCQFDPVYIKLPGVKGAPGGPEGGLKSHFMQGINVPKNGYLYVYCSNESNVDVFFDNLEVVHTRGAILEETHYYPFGLVMSGISSKAAGSLTNRYKFNGIEQENDFDLNYSEAFYRTIDPQTGRFLQIDPVTTHDESPYVMMGNNPVKNIDWLGNYFTWGSQDVHDRYDRLRKDNNEKLSGYMKELGGLDLNSTDDNVQNRICELQSLVNISTGLNSQWNEMEIADVEFNVADGKTSFGGVTSYNADKNRIDIKLSETNLEDMSHEIRHGYGYLKGELVGTNGAPDLLYDRMDEVAAYNAGLFFSKYKGYDKKVANGYFNLDMLTTRGALRSKAYDGLKGKDRQLTLNTPAAELLSLTNDSYIKAYIQNNASNANLTVRDVFQAVNDLDKKAGRPATYIFGDALKNR